MNIATVMALMSDGLESGFPSRKWTGKWIRTARNGKRKGQGHAPGPHPPTGSRFLFLPAGPFQVPSRLPSNSHQP